MTAGPLTADEVRELERRVANLPVEEADRLVDRAFHVTGVSWLRRHGWLPPAPVDTAADEDTEVAS